MRLGERTKRGGGKANETRTHRKKLYAPRVFTSNVFHHTSGSFWCIATPTRISAPNPNKRKTAAYVCPRTLVERGYSTSIRDEDVEPPKVRKERLYRLLDARRLAHVHDKHEHLRARYSVEDRALRLAERFFGACGYC